MKIIYHNLTIALAFFLAGLQVITAQKFEKKYHESFKVNKDVVISLNTFYTDVVIETWNRNTVDVSATIIVEGKNLKQGDADKYFKNWHFEALGNHKKISIKGDNYRFYGFLVPKPKTPLMPRLPVIPELSIKNLDILDSFKLVAPVVNDLVFEAMAFNSLKLDSLHFDFDAYKKNKNYLKEYQKRAYAQASKIRQQMLKVERKKRVVELKRLIEARVEMDNQRKEFAVQRQELLRHQKEMRSRQHDAAKRIRAVLVKRNKVKLKKTIYIKVPKGAKFNMNVSYGSVKFPS